MLQKFFSKTPDNEKNSPKFTHEQVLVIIKSDAFARTITGRIITDIEKDFCIVAMKTITLNEKQVEQLYGGAKHFDFYPALKQYMMTGFHLAMVIEGQNVIQRMLEAKGKIAKEDPTHTLRNKYGVDKTISTIHSSHNAKDASREISLFFKKEEIYQKNPPLDQYLTISGSKQPQSKHIVP